MSPHQAPIKGWAEAMQLMAEGDKWRLFIPYDLGYGENGLPPNVPPFSPLVVEVEIHKVKSTGGRPVTAARQAFQDALAITHQEL